MCVSLFLTHGHSFELIGTKFGVWHPYNFRWVVGRLASAARARRLALHAPFIYAAANGWRASSGNSQPHRAAGATGRAPQTRESRSSRAYSVYTPTTCTSGLVHITHAGLLLLCIFHSLLASTSYSVVRVYLSSSSSSSSLR